jgi:hypothetical protein
VRHAPRPALDECASRRFAQQCFTRNSFNLLKNRFTADPGIDLALQRPTRNSERSTAAKGIE